ncbi:tetratricopeptide repeat protein [Treponema sp.]|uniref:tetratricopeptide repeat protein n=1 Tax=Treponema sp. TaxID=166 RepID=UPI00298E48F9|nr:tetratricopeptide repeat protein [Treponema sp.]MCR5612566.1 tetratricopeptide repeat protein [Treponema sp.]
MKRQISCAIFLTALFTLFTSCTKSNKTIIRMQHIEEGVANPQSIEDYQEAIKKYEERVADIQLAQAQIGIWHKIVGSRYMDKKMYGEALKSFQAALEYYPDNQNLYYYVGLCASYMSHTALDYDAVGRNDKKAYYLNLAEESYKRAIKIDERYTRALYALAVLYEFEFTEQERTDEAIPLLETVVSIEKKNLDALTLLARCYYRTYQFDKAVEVYDRIIETTNVPARKQMAKDFKEQVLKTKAEFEE